MKGKEVIPVSNRSEHTISFLKGAAASLTAVLGVQALRRAIVGAQTGRELRVAPNDAPALPVPGSDSADTDIATPHFEPEPKNYLTDDYSLKSWLLTTDHKRIAILYALTITLFFFVGGLAATLIRMQLVEPQGHLVQQQTYNKLFTMHGVIMVWFFLIPSVPTTLGNFLLPLMIGARDLAFPKLNLFSWYLLALGGLFTFLAILTGGVDTGWTFYTPLSTHYVHTKVMLTAAGVFVSGFSSILTGLNFIVTIHRMRCPGMTWFRLPIFVWTLYATSLILVLGTPVLTVTLMLMAAERLFGIGIFDPALGGDPLLFQHLFWFYSHPAVYIMILPGMGVISETITCFARKQIFSYKMVALASMGIAIFGFFVWGHHMFVAGQSMYAGMAFSLLSYLVAIPSAIKVFNWTATLYKGLDSAAHAHAICARVHRPVHGRRIKWAVSGRPSCRCFRPRHLFRHRALPLHHGGRHGNGVPGRPAFLVAQNHRQAVPGKTGAALGIADLFRLCADVPAAIPARSVGHEPTLLSLRARISTAQHHVYGRRVHTGGGVSVPVFVSAMVAEIRTARACKPLGRDRAGMADALAAAQA